MQKKWIIVSAICLVLLLGCAMIGPIMSNVEHPKYRVISSVDNIEIREYRPMIVAEVAVQGKRKKALVNGFQLLADYIFGNNTARQDVAMTAPVQQQANEKIAMTAPVQQQSSGDVWRVSFVMPSKYTMATLPKPNNDRIALHTIPAKRFIAIRFSGINSNGNIDKHEKKLLQYAEVRQIQTIGLPKYAFYNPPWTLPFMRRNEIMIETDN